MHVQQPVLLRNGVYVARGIKREGSHYYLVDEIIGSETHISVEFAAFILGEIKPWHNIDNDDLETFHEYLETNRLLFGQTAFPKKDKSILQLILGSISQNIPLCYPHNVLVTFKPYWSWLFGPYALILIGILLAAAFGVLYSSFTPFIDGFSTYKESGASVIFALIIAKSLHELGHSMAIIKAGGYVKSINIMFIAGAPMPKNDAQGLIAATNMEKIKIALAGIYMEFLLALVCVLLWKGCESDFFEISFHFIAAVSLPMTVAMNMIPLMKFDGYHVIANLLNNPRLYEDGIDSFREFCYRLIGLESYEWVPLKKGQVGATLTAYGAGIALWKVMLPSGIAIGIVSVMDARIMYVVAVIPFISMLILPLLGELKLMTNYIPEKLNIKNKIALLLPAIVMFVFCIWALIPMHHIKSAPGAVILDFLDVKSPIEGNIVKQLEQGDVLQGEVIVRISPLNLSVDEVQVQADVQKANTLILAGEKNASISEYENRAAYLMGKNQGDAADGLITAKQNGYWKPVRTSGSLTGPGKKMGTIFYDSGKVVALIPNNRKTAEIINVTAVYDDASRQRVSLTKVSTTKNLEGYPEYLLNNVSKGAMHQIYVSETVNNGLGQPLTIYYAEKYSVAARFITKLWHAF